MSWAKEKRSTTDAVRPIEGKPRRLVVGMMEDLVVSDVPFTHDPWCAARSRYDEMPYRRVGDSGLLLPAISLGLWYNFGDNRPFEIQREVLHYAFDRGITHFDLANNYETYAVWIRRGELRPDAAR